MGFNIFEILSIENLPNFLFFLKSRNVYTEFLVEIVLARAECRKNLGDFLGEF